MAPLDPANGQGGTNWALSARQVILEVAQHEASKAYFNAPPPGAGGGAPCFAAILRRLSDGGYPGPDDMHADIQRVWALCRALHPPGSDTVRAADQLAPMVDMLWRHMGLGDAGNGVARQAEQQAQQAEQVQQHAGQGLYLGQVPYRPSPELPLGLDPQPNQQQANLALMQRQQAQQQAQQAQQQQQQRLALLAAQQGGGAPRQRSPFGLGPPVGNGSAGAVPGAAAFGSDVAFGGASLSMGLGGGGASMSLEPPASGLSGGSGYDGLSLLHMQQAAQLEQLAAHQRLAAAERAKREHRRLALVRLKHEMLTVEHDPSAPHPLLDGLNTEGLCLPSPPAHQPQRQTSLAEQQQQMLEAMASGQMPPPGRGEGGPLGGAHPLASSIRPAELGGSGGAAGPFAHQQQQQTGGGGGGPMAENDRQRQRLALLKHNMLAALQQRQAAHAQLQQVQMQAGQQQAQQQAHAQQQQPYGGVAPLLGQQASLGQHIDAGLLSLMSPNSSSLLLGSPTASGYQASDLRRGGGRRGGAQGVAADDSQQRHAELHRCLLVLDRLLQHPEAKPFSEPVDAQALGIPDYPTVIKRPMDLGTIKGRLALGLHGSWERVPYWSAAEALSDVQLVWANCRQYNAAGSPITEMCARVEAAFCRLWEEAGLGTAVAAAARPHGLAQPSPLHAASHRKQQHHRPPAKQPPRSHKAGGGHTHSSKQARRLSGGGGGSSGKRQRGEAAAMAAKTPSPAAAPSASLPGTTPGRPGSASLAASLAGTAPHSEVATMATQQQQLEQEQEEEALQLQSLLSTGGSSPLAGMAAEAAASPLLWEDAAAGLDAAQEAGAGGAAVLDGDADPFAAQWQAAGGAAAAALPSSAAGSAGVAAVLMHPDWQPAVEDSLPLAMMPQAQVGAAAAATRPLSGADSQGQLRLPAMLSGLAAATAAVTSEQLQQEQAVLAAWQQVQQQRQAAAQAIAAAEAAAQELERARKEAAMEAASAAWQPLAEQPQQQPSAGEGGSEMITAPAGRRGGAPAGTLWGPNLRAAAAAARSSDERIAIATSARQARHQHLVALGAELFGVRRSGGDGVPSAAAGEGGSSCSTLAGRSGSPQACARSRAMSPSPPSQLTAPQAGMPPSRGASGAPLAAFAAA